MIVLQGAREPVEAIDFSPDGRTLVGVYLGGAQLWDDLTASGPPAAVLGYRQVRSIRFTPDGRKVLLGRNWGRVLVHDLATGEAAEFSPDDPALDGGYSELTPDGRYVVLAQVNTLWDEQSRLSCQSIADLVSPVWSVSTSRYVYSPPLFLAGGKEFVVFEGEPETIPFWYVTRDAQTGKVVTEVPGTGEQFTHPVISPDRWLIAGRRGVWVGVFRAEDMGAEPVTFRNDSRKEFTGLAFHPSGRYLAATSNDRTVKLYDTTTWAVAEAYTWGIGRLRSVAFSPDGMLAAAGGDSGKIVVWDVDP